MDLAPSGLQTPTRTPKRVLVGGFVSLLLHPHDASLLVCAVSISKSFAGTYAPHSDGAGVLVPSIPLQPPRLGPVCHTTVVRISNAWFL